MCYLLELTGQVYSWDADVKVDDRNLWKTTLSKIKIKKQYEVVAVSGGGQHAAFLAVYSPK